MEKDIFFEKELELEVQKQIGKLQKPQRLNMALIRKYSGAPTDGGSEAVAAHLGKLVRLRLDFLSIPRIENLDFFADTLKELYLQGNGITKIEELECLVNLELLALQSNKIVSPIGSNIKRLTKLEYLNLGDNNISAINVDTELPDSLMILNLAGNAVSPPSGKAQYHLYRTKMALAFPHLKRLDGVDVEREDSAAAEIHLAATDASSSVRFVASKTEGQKQLDDIMAKACSEIEGFYGTRKEDLAARMEAVTAGIAKRCQERAQTYSGSIAAVEKKRREAKAGKAKTAAVKDTNPYSQKRREAKAGKE